ncbi:MAG: hypothetical protein KGZ90_17190 [Algoriphagus sp.]|nr:hypothetical protein [Algoriphagus sp.]
MQTVAALASAIAAIAALWVARSTFSFQRNSLLKAANLEHIVKILQQLYYFKSLTGQPVLDASDEDVTGLGQKIAEAKHSIVLLEAMVPESARTEIMKVNDIVQGLHEGDIFPTGQGGSNSALRARLNDAIDALQCIYRKEMK